MQNFRGLDQNCMKPPKNKKVKSGGQLSWGPIVTGGNCHRGQLSRRQLSGGQLSRGHH